MPEFHNIPLLSGEEVLFAADFTPHPIFRSRKSGLVVTRQRVAVLHPQYMFLFFRVGQQVSSTPNESIAEVSVGRLLSRRHVGMAGIFGLFGFFALVFGGVIGRLGGGIGVLALLIAFLFFGAAAFQLWLARSLGLTVHHFGGGALGVGVDSAEHQAMLHAANIIQQLMVDARTGTKRPVPAAPPPAANSTPIGTPVRVPTPRPTW